MPKYKKIEVPDIGDFHDVPVVELLVRPGERIEADAPLITLESDKATMDVPAPCAGTVHELLVAVGDRLSLGAPILILETPAADASDHPYPAVDPADRSQLSREVAETAAALDPDAEYAGSRFVTDQSVHNEPPAPVPESVPETIPENLAENISVTRPAMGATVAPPPAREASAAKPPPIPARTGATTIELRVPDIGEFDQVEVIEVHIRAGDKVAVEDPLITLESDKAAMDVPATSPGEVVAVYLQAGDKVGEGGLIARLVPAGPKADGAKAAPQLPVTPPAESPPVPSPGASPSEPQPPQTLPTLHPERSANPHASPAVRRFARDLGVDLTRLEGSGRKGRILTEDVQCFVRNNLNPGDVSRGGTFTLAQIPKIDFSRFGDTESRSLGRIKKLTATHLHRAWLNVPQVTHHDEADITDLDAFRRGAQADAADHGLQLTMLAFAMKACGAILQQYPSFNASLDNSGENLILKKYCHIGVAVDTAHGRVVPVVRDVERKGIFELARDLADLGARARDAKLQPRDMQGASFTISSLGGIGGTGFTPIVNAPEVAILGLSRSSLKPVYQEGRFVPRLMLPLSLSYDHRVIDGAEAARFVVSLAQVLSDIRRLLI